MQLDCQSGDFYTQLDKEDKYNTKVLIPLQKLIKYWKVALKEDTYVWFIQELAATME